MNRVCARLPIFSSIIIIRRSPTLEGASAWEPWAMFPYPLPMGAFCGCPELYSVEGSPQISPHGDQQVFIINTCTGTMTSASSETNMTYTDYCDA